MNKTATRIRLTQGGLAVAAAALLMFALPVMSRIQSGTSDHATVRAHQGIQVADGSESNGGKGGKGGAKRSGLA